MSRIIFPNQLSFQLWGGFGSIVISFVLPLIPKLEMNTVFNTLCLSKYFHSFIPTVHLQIGSHNFLCVRRCTGLVLDSSDGYGCIRCPTSVCPRTNMGYSHNILNGEKIFQSKSLRKIRDKILDITSKTRFYKLPTARFTQ